MKILSIQRCVRYYGAPSMVATFFGGWLTFSRCLMRFCWRLEIENPNK